MLEFVIMVVIDGVIVEIACRELRNFDLERMGITCLQCGREDVV